MSRTIHVRSSQDLGELIAEARRRVGKTQRQVASELGVTQAWISRVERGQQKAWIGKVLRLAAYLGVRLTGSIPSTEELAKEKEASTDIDLDELVK